MRNGLKQINCNSIIAEGGSLGVTNYHFPSPSLLLFKGETAACYIMINESKIPTFIFFFSYIRDYIANLIKYFLPFTCSITEFHVRPASYVMGFWIGCLFPGCVSIKIVTCNFLWIFCIQLFPSKVMIKSF